MDGVKWPYFALELALLLFVHVCLSEGAVNRGKRDVSTSQWMQDLATEVNSQESSTWQAATDHIVDPVQKRQPFFFPWRKHSEAKYKHIVDWRTSRVIREPESQGWCGSCWAFASTHAFNDRVNIERRRQGKREVAPLSVQHVMECTCSRYPKSCGIKLFPFPRRSTSGCDGVVSSAVGSLFLHAYGTTDLKCKRYRSIWHGKPCRQHCDDGYNIASSQVHRLYHYAVLPNLGRKGRKYIVELMKKALRQGPLVVSLSTTWGFMLYRRGIYSSSLLSRVFPTGGHLVELVGYGEKVTGKNKTTPYWIIKNTWGSRWGHNGYGYIRAGTNELNIESRCVLVPLVNRRQYNEFRKFAGIIQRSVRMDTMPADPICQKQPITAEELDVSQYSEAMDFLDSVAVNRPDMLPGCYENKQYNRALLNGTHQVVDCYLYTLTVEYTTPRCPGDRRVFRGVVALDFYSGRYSLLQGDVLASETRGQGCVCPPPAMPYTYASHSPAGEREPYWNLWKAASQALSRSH